MTGTRPYTGSRGFTLVEILLAISIFSTIALAVSSLYRSVLHAGSMLEQERRIWNLGVRCISVIADDLNSIYVTPLEFYRQPSPGGAPDRYRVWGIDHAAVGTSQKLLRFVSSPRLSANENMLPGLAEIQYHIEEDTDGDRVLRRRQQNIWGTGKEGRYAPRICRRVSALRLEFLSSDGERYDHWDSDSREFGFATPVAVRIELVLSADGHAYRFGQHVPLPVFRGGTK